MGSIIKVPTRKIMMPFSQYFMFRAALLAFRRPFSQGVSQRFRRIGGLVGWLVLLLCASCQLFRPAPTPAVFAESASGYQRRPEIWVEYYPYPLPGGPPPLIGVRPLPDYRDSWTDQRMQRDLSRIRSAGISAILLFLAPEKLGDPFFCDRVRHFQGLAAGLTPPLPVALVLASFAPLRLDRQNVMDFFQTQGFAHDPHYLSWQGQRPLFFSESIHLLGSYGGLQTAAQFGAELPPRPLDASGFNASNGAVWIKAARIAAEQTDIRGRAWLIPRSGGTALADRLRQAFAQQASPIILSSWNDFSDGSFLEPNSHDQDLLLRTLQAALAALPPSPAP